MKHDNNPPQIIDSISRQHELLGLPAPEHPLISLINFKDLIAQTTDVSVNFSTGFYTITIKKDCKCKMEKYGQNYADFDQGVMSFLTPGQLLSWGPEDVFPTAGWLLVIHPDLIRNYALAQKIKSYSFFNYSLNEALHLSKKEETMVETIMKNVKREYQSNIDSYSQDVMVSHIELLLNYANRFYNRQFITRKNVNHDFLMKIETLLSVYINGGQIKEQGLPTVRYLSEQLHMSPNYLGDLLKKITGKSTQQHIHHILIEKAKDILASSNLSVSEIAYQLGFEYPQSFSKLFKQKTSLSPLGYRNSVN